MLRVKLDLHVHTIYSKDSVLTIDDVLKAAADMGLQGVAITDHDTLRAHQHTTNSQPVMVIRGVEISTSDGHILAYGIREEIPPGLSAAETIDRIRSMDGVAVVAHVGRTSGNTVKASILRNLNPHALETVNASTWTPWAKRRGHVLAEKLGFAETAGTDSHASGLIGRVWTVVETEEVDETSILKSIASGLTSTFGGSAYTIHRLKPSIHALKKRLGL